MWRWDDWSESQPAQCQGISKNAPPKKMLINLNSWMTNIPLGLPEEGIENIPSLIFIELIKIHY